MEKQNRLAAPQQPSFPSIIADLTFAASTCHPRHRRFRNGRTLATPSCFASTNWITIALVPLQIIAAVGIPCVPVRDIGTDCDPHDAIGNGESARPADMDLAGCVRRWRGKSPISVNYSRMGQCPLERTAPPLAIAVEEVDNPRWPETAASFLASYSGPVWSLTDSNRAEQPPRSWGRFRLVWIWCSSCALLTNRVLTAIHSVVSLGVCPDLKRDGKPR